MKRIGSLLPAAAAVAGISAFALAGGAGAASSLPTLNVALSGTSGVSVSGSTVSGAVNVTATHTGKTAPMGASFALVRLNPNESAADAIASGFGAVQSAHGNLDALTATGNALIVSANAPGTVQTVLTPGNYVALNTSSQHKPSFASFTVTKSASPAALPAAKATEASIEFGFKGPKVLKVGSVVRAENKGYLVHMIDLVGLKSKAVWPKVRRLLLAGAHQKAFRPFLSGQFVSLLNPASPGALQQMTLSAKPGYYAEVCFMNAQDGREHTQFGMERLVKVVK